MRIYHFFGFFNWQIFSSNLIKKFLNKVPTLSVSLQKPFFSLDNIEALYQQKNFSQKK